MSQFHLRGTLPNRGLRVAERVKESLATVQMDINGNRRRVSHQRGLRAS